MALDHIGKLASDVAAIRTNVASIEATEKALREDLNQAVTAREEAELRNEVDRGKVTELSLRNELRQVASATGTTHEAASVSKVVCDPTVEADSRSGEQISEAPTETSSIDYIHVSSAHKLYARELEADRMSRIGDFCFPDARMTWRWLMQDFPVRPEMLRRLVGWHSAEQQKKCTKKCLLQTFQPPLTSSETSWKPKCIT
jgi:hypothetical protein